MDKTYDKTTIKAAETSRRKRRPGRHGPRVDPESMFRVPPSKAGSKRVLLNCHYCGYSPPTLPAGGVCPKCGGQSWERFAISRRFIPEDQQ